MKVYNRTLKQMVNKLRCCFLIGTLFMILPSCKDEKRIKPDHVESLVFYAMPKGIHRPYSLVSFQELKREGRDTLILDRTFIQKFIGMVNRLQPGETRSIDLRSAVIVKQENGDSLIVAFGENWGTVVLRNGGKDKWIYDESDNTFYPSMDVNGDFMKDSPSLFRFINRYVYGPHSNEYWFDDSTREIHKRIKEHYPSQ